MLHFVITGKQIRKECQCANNESKKNTHCFGVNIKKILKMSLFIAQEQQTIKLENVLSHITYFEAEKTFTIKQMSHYFCLEIS
jgi:hypothetical protein